MRIDKKRTLIATVCFLTIGLLSDTLIDKLSIFVVPFVFGLVLPIVNWRNLGERKIMKLTFVLLTSLILFYLTLIATMTLGESSLIAISIILGLSGVGEYLFSSLFIRHLDRGLIQIGFVLVLGILSLPTASLLADSFSGGIGDFLFLTWTIQVGLGMSLGHRLRSNEDEDKLMLIKNKV